MKTIDYKLANITPEQSDRFEQLAIQLAEPFQLLIINEHISPQQLNHHRLLNTYIPIAEWLYLRNHQPHFVGINGAQGSGKSTLCKILALILHEGFKQQVVTLSIDDLYLTRSERQILSEERHPLLITRGVPGSHDITMGLKLFQQLRQNHGEIAIPQFDKSQDDRSPQSNWPIINLPVDIVLFEGWCVGTRPQIDEDLLVAVNSLEVHEDSDGSWRQYVNQQLTEHYPALFEQLDTLLMLEIPDYKMVMEWRSLQEQKLHQQSHRGQQQLMNKTMLQRFIMHYERLTHANLTEMPARADLLLKLNKSHQISEIIEKSPFK